MSHLLVVTPWYPSPDKVYAGTFVRESVRCLAPWYDEITVVHAENCPPDDARPPSWRDTPEGRVRWVPVPMDPMTPRWQMMDLQRDALRQHAADLIEAADVVHCHVGAPTGAGLVELLGPQTRLVLTEHATYLRRVARDPEAVARYRRLLERADVVTAVSSVSADELLALFPGARERVEVVANPVPLRLVPRRSGPPTELSRWLFVGNLVAHKGVVRLVRAFAAQTELSGGAADTLTVVGDGPLRGDLEALAAELGVADRVRFLGGLPPEQVLPLYAEHDVLVHLSHIETFGITCVEAAAAGMAVVVTRCGAPEETLLLHAALGLAEFVPVAGDEQVDDVLAAVATVRGSVAKGRVDLARRHLERTIDAPVVGARLHDLLTGAPAGQVSALPGLRALAVAFTPAQASAAEGTMRHLAAFGGGGVLVTTHPPRHALPPTVRVIDIADRYGGLAVSRAERAVVLQAPAAVLRGAGKLARLAAPVAPGPSQQAQRVVRGVQRRHQDAARRFRSGPYARVLRDIGPWSLARLLERDGLFTSPEVTQCDFMIHTDETQTPVAVRALRANARLTIRRHFGPRAAALLYADRVLDQEIALPQDAETPPTETPPAETPPSGTSRWATV